MTHVNRTILPFTNLPKTWPLPSPSLLLLALYLLITPGSINHPCSFPLATSPFRGMKVNWVTTWDSIFKTAEVLWLNSVLGKILPFSFSSCSKHVKQRPLKGIFTAYVCVLHWPRPTSTYQHTRRKRSFSASHSFPLDYENMMRFETGFSLSVVNMPPLMFCCSFSTARGWRISQTRSHKMNHSGDVQKPAAGD